MGVALSAELLSRYLAVGPGARLPPERHLANEFGVSRSEIRKALAELEQGGRVSRQIGRGTFVAAPKPDPVSDSTSLKRNTSAREAMEARLLIEPELAGLAAINATYEQIERMRSLAQNARMSDTWEAYEQHDGDLHRLIAAAAANKLLVAVHALVDDVRRSVVWRSLSKGPGGPPSDYTSFAEHDAILDAIERRDRSAARQAMERHLGTTMRRLIGPP